MRQEGRPPDAVSLDLSDPKAVDEIVALRPDAIVHFAAGVPAQHLGPEAERVAEVNRRIDFSVLRVSKRLRARMIYASSVSVYGKPSDVAVDEQSATNPSGPYAWEKLETEAEGEELFEEERAGFIGLRIAAPYGPGQNKRTVLRIFVENALQGLPLLYHGSGSRQQDFIHSRDVAESVICALERGSHGIYNVASGNPIEMKRLAELVVSCVPRSRSEVASSGQPDPQEGAKAGYCIEKIQTELGWTPQVTLAEGISAWAQESAGWGFE